MVSLAFVLFTVSTLATLNNALPKDLPVRHLCGDETFCDIKPPDYPQEKIDKLVLKMLPQLRRTKRQAMAVEPDMPQEEGNCEFTFKEVKSFTMRNNEEMPQFLVQSKWFTQSFPQITCKSDNPQPENDGQQKTCFSDFLSSSGKRTSCKTKTVSITAIVYDSIHNKIANGNATIGIDCVCVII